jgi:hypothetical protein
MSEEHRPEVRAAGLSVGAPPDVTAQERWIVKNAVVAVRVEYRQTGTDTAETYLHLTPSDGKAAVCWLASTFRKFARLELGHCTVAVPIYGLREKVEAREKWEQANARELADYKRLKAKFEGGDDAAMGTAILAGARADGGPITSGRAYLVGERWPEIMVPGSSGM